MENVEEKNLGLEIIFWFFDKFVHLAIFMVGVVWWLILVNIKWTFIFFMGLMTALFTIR